MWPEFCSTHPREMKMHVHNNLYANVYGSFTYNPLNLTTKYASVGKEWHSHKNTIEQRQGAAWGRAPGCPQRQTCRKTQVCACQRVGKAWVGVWPQKGPVTGSWFVVITSFYAPVKIQQEVAGGGGKHTQEAEAERQPDLCEFEASLDDILSYRPDKSSKPWLKTNKHQRTGLGISLVVGHLPNTHRPWVESHLGMRWPRKLWIQKLNWHTNLNLKKIYVYFLCMSVFPTCMYVQYMDAWCPMRPEKGTEFLGTGSTDSCEPRGGWWESNPSLLQEQ